MDSSEKANIRINQFLARCGLGSRRSVETLIQEGLVEVNNQIISNLGIRVEAKDEVRVKGKIVNLPNKFTYVLFNKPKGCICTKIDPQNRKTIYDILPKSFAHLNYAGRLDYNSYGLLLLCNNGDVIQNLTKPSSKIERVYEVKIHKELSSHAKQLIEKGMSLENGIRTRPINLEINPKFLKMKLTEGKNREIRKIFEKLGYFVKDLKRVSFGPLRLGNLKSGDSRTLSNQEIKEISALKG